MSAPRPPAAAWLFAACCFAALARAAPDCPAPRLSPAGDAGGGAPAAVGLHVEAGRLSGADDHLQLERGVRAAEGPWWAEAESGRLDGERLELEGGVRYRSPELELDAERLSRARHGAALDAEALRFAFPELGLAGAAARLARPDAEHSRLQDLELTRCDPQDPDWRFAAARLDLDHAEGLGRARHLSLWLGPVPVLYLPYLVFPIDERRRSGLLYPSFGDSSRHGFEYAQPIYWNIAPQADATFTPTWLSRRGLKLDTEWRLLTRHSTSRLRTAHLDDEVTGTARRLFDLDHRERLGDRWSLSVDYLDTSDPDHFRDFGDGPDLTSRTTWARTTRLSGQYPNARVALYWRDHLALDPAIGPESLPYRLWPRFEFEAHHPAFAQGFDFDLEASHTVFDHARRVNAERLDLYPRLSRPFGGAGWFLTPAIGGRYTRYRLTQPDPAAAPPEPATIERSLPIAELDAGLIFERDWGERLLQTLEPRLYYVRIPYRPQDDIPLLDTRAPDLNLTRLFVPNRYSGIDRIGDTEQLTSALSTRLLDRTSGLEHLRLSVGRIRYHAPRRVMLSPGAPPETEPRSDWMIELDGEWGAWRWRGRWQREPDGGAIVKRIYDLRYVDRGRRVLQLGYRERRAEPPVAALRQAEFGLAWPIAGGWSVFARRHRDLEARLDYERLFGLEYESCCWAFRLMARRALIDATRAPGDPDTPRFDEGLYFELSLKGLGNAGSDIGRRLEERIIGYQDPYP